uniref:Uncharacterized protein n=1 Tax=Podoviridae sp. ctsNK10 TaxID=2826582 RepID=A0A8S5NLC6_9CAUD|nr:MAG TPA: hypothetical protein [Podoviridae sp. ctsNK10]DAJ73314.1 MAG TPA: hypothetical protein [Caudoviricetes sp.]
MRRRIHIHAWYYRYCLQRNAKTILLVYIKRHP